MASVWNLGNTTLRNPNRIVTGLKLFAEQFQGKVHGEEEEKAFAKALVENNIVDSDGSYDDLLGRKWRSAFVKLGFVTNTSFKWNELSFDYTQLSTILNTNIFDVNKKYILTPVGKRLVNATTTSEIDDIYLRQLVATEMPSILESSYKGRPVKPFILILQVLWSLHNQSQKGLSKEEISIFLQVADEHTQSFIDNITQKIIQYRTTRNNIEGKMNKLALDKELLEESAKKGNVKKDTLRDYADTTVRYSLMSGMLTFNSRRIIIKEDKLSLVKKITENEPKFICLDNPQDYLRQFYFGKELPIDDLEFSKQLTKILERKLGSLTEMKKPVVRDIENLSLPEVTSIRYRLEENIKEINEEKFAIAQMESSSITEIYKTILAFKENNRDELDEFLDKPAYFEWYTWRAFLAIDSIKNKIEDTRGFPIDDEMHPRHPASGGKPDMLFEFDDFVFVVEVTLTTSTRQVIAESEPVRRHVAKVQKDNSKEVYGIFIAPTIDNNILEHFRTGVYYEGDIPTYINIMPFNLSQFSLLIQKLNQRRYSPLEIKKLIEKCLSYRNIATHEWKNIIESELNKWVANDI